MKQLHILLLVCAFSVSSTVMASGLDCAKPNPLVPNVFENNCRDGFEAVKNHILKEIQSSSNYLAAGSYFIKSTVNRDGFAKFLFTAAKKARHNAQKLMDYLLNRGAEVIHTLIEVPNPSGGFIQPESGVGALREALIMESALTKSIKAIIDIFENCRGSPQNDHHFVQYLIDEFLDEQYYTQRKLAGMISTLGKMMSKNGAIGEFLFDKKLLQ